MKRLLFGVLLCLLLSYSADAQSTGFTYEPATDHSMLFLLKDVWANARDVGAGIVRFNFDYFAEYRLEVKRYTMPYLSASPVYYVTGFANQQEVMRYYELLNELKPSFLQVGTLQGSWPISTANFNQVIIQQSLEGYSGFYTAHYEP